MPKPIEVSVDEYLDTRKLSAHDGVAYRAVKMPKSFDAESRSATFTMTSEDVDSYGDVVRAKGADLTRFLSNPIALLNHRSDQIVGTWSDVEQKTKRIDGKVTLAKAGTSPVVDQTFSLMEQGILRAASIGFVPLQIERILDADGEWNGGFDIKAWSMFETSIVSIPANPAALAKAMKQGDVLARDLIEQVLDEYVKTPAGLIIPREEIEAAHKTGSGEKTSVLTTKIELDQKSLDRLEKIAERMEKAADAVVAGTVELSVEPAEPEVDPVVQELELNVEGFLKDIEPKVEEIAEPERKSALTKLVDGIRGLFKTAEPGAEPESAPPPADPEVQKALKERLAKIAAPEAA
jgi:HK97 family phage prohead protease